ncbi:MAG: hypothetical protein JWO26_3416 [Rhodospirillales bacterium]|nr:hypothetical protein [Rhodospirillales bacterium]MDB5383784.1 hypothetical protein [Rhodospirillales bacterium]
MTEVSKESSETDILLGEEVLSVSKRAVETGKVRVSVTTEAVEEIVRETLRTRRAEIERVPLDQRVTEAPQTRQEGDVLIIPVVEEILVIERHLVLKEEIRLRFVDGEQTTEQSVTRRVQHAVVERVPAATTARPVVPPTNTNQD